jgi:hypothetical protein
LVTEKIPARRTRSVATPHSCMRLGKTQTSCGGADSASLSSALLVAFRLPVSVRRDVKLELVPTLSIRFRMATRPRFAEVGGSQLGVLSHVDNKSPIPILTIRVFTSQWNAILHCYKMWRIVHASLRLLESQTCRKPSSPDRSPIFSTKHLAAPTPTPRARAPQLSRAAVASTCTRHSPLSVAKNIDMWLIGPSPYGHQNCRSR